MKRANRILRFIYAFFLINFIYNINKFQCILKSHEWSDCLIILILSVVTFVILLILDAIFDYIIKLFLICKDKAYTDGINNKKPIKAMKSLKCTNLILDINVLFSPNLYYKFLELFEKQNFYKLSKADKLSRFRLIIEIIINYVLIISTIYVLYMRTDYINNIITFIKEIDISSYKNLFKIIIDPKVIGVIISLICVFIYSRRKNKIKEIINKDEKNLEEEVTLKIKELCKYFIADRDIILHNIYALIENKKHCLSAEEAIASKTNLNFNQSKVLMNVNNAEKLKSLTNYFLYNENCIYYFYYNSTESSFLLFYSKLNFYLKNKHGEAVLDILFDTENYINTFLKKDKDGTEFLYNDHIYNALQVLIVLIYFAEDFKKYTRTGIVNNDFFKKVTTLLEKTIAIQKIINKK